MSLSLCPTIDGQIGVHSTFGFGTDLNATLPLRSDGNNVVIETGYYIWPGTEWERYFFAGIGFHFEYWKKEIEHHYL